jgi:hypothetical protein
MKSRRCICLPLGTDHADCNCVQLQQGFVTGETGFRASLHGSNPKPLMSALGQKRTLALVKPMSALPPKADIVDTAEKSAPIITLIGSHEAVLPRSNVVVSNFRPNSRARRQELFSSARDGRRAISAYLSRYLALAESQKLSGWNCAITLIGAPGICLGYPSQHWVRTALDMIGHHQMADRIILTPFGDESEVPGHCLPVPRRLG